jgi:hypothetical protein
VPSRRFSKRRAARDALSCFQIEQILQQQQQTDAHQPQRLAALFLAGQLNQAGCLKMLRPAQAHQSSRSAFNVAFSWAVVWIK